MVKNALEPFWEARFEEIIYGFRPGRGCYDAIEKLFRLDLDMDSATSVGPQDLFPR